MTKKGLFKCIIFAMFICMAVSCRVEAAGDDGNKPPVPVTPVYDWYETPIDVETGNAPDKSTKFVFFGVFPRSVVKQEGTTLYGKDKVTEITIDESEENSITRGAYTYYKGSDNEYYYKMAENAYADYTKYSDGSDVNKLSANSERWFLVEPIKWRIVTKSYNGNGDAYFVADEILNGNIPYFYSTGKRTIEEKSINANSYKYSQIRAYLNGIVYYDKDSNEQTDYCKNNEGTGFLQTAFTDSAQKMIEAANILEVEGEALNSKIFIISANELTKFSSFNPIFGLTDFAKANYVKGGSSNALQNTQCGEEVWLRSPGSVTTNACCVSDSGEEGTSMVNNKYLGIVPSFFIKLQ